MSMREPNLFSRKTKLLVGVPLAACVVLGMAYDPELYQSVVGALTLPVAVAFPLVYMTLPWKQTVLGRALMTHARSIALLYVVGVTGTYLTLPFDGYLMAVVATYLAIGLGYQFIVLLRIKHAAIQQEQIEESVT
jgi:hypothetical protein